MELEGGLDEMGEEEGEAMGWLLCSVIINMTIKMERTERQALIVLTPDLIYAFIIVLDLRTVITVNVLI